MALLSRQSPGWLPSAQVHPNVHVRAKKPAAICSCGFLRGTAVQRLAPVMLESCLFRRLFQHFFAGGFIVHQLKPHGVE
ncbi:hypothetical protein, partial [Comamonas jiangduensis]|uniref:hypothetical protein n=1 Tax=Comamonas jiangduensis TaxID=1194168 RepID=UPI0024E04E08